jgi:hypothetical protein
MWAPSKNPDDYLRGQPGYPPRRGAVKRVPVLWSLAALVITGCLAAVVAHALGADWDRAVTPFGLAAGLSAQAALGLWWSASGRARPD